MIKLKEQFKRMFPQDEYKIDLINTIVEALPATRRITFWRLLHMNHIEYQDLNKAIGESLRGTLDRVDEDGLNPNLIKNTQ